MKHYLIYQIRNKLNGMIYIGQHQTENLDDGYMGSGLRIQRAIEKYGVENFEKTILFECNSEEEMNQKEAEIVNEDFIARDDVYNIVPGGWSGGFKFMVFSAKSRASKTRWKNMTDEKKAQISDKIRKYRIGKSLSKETRKKISEVLKHVYANDPSKHGTTGKKLSIETKQKLSKSHIGNKNSQYGMMWICNDLTKSSIRIKKDSVIPSGWRKGRICKI